MAAKTADISGQLLDYGGNYLWNQEIQEQNQDYLTTKFRKVRDFKTTLKEGDGCVCEEWNEVSYRSVPLQKLS